MQDQFIANQTESNKIKCPTCRQTTRVEELAHAYVGSQHSSLGTRSPHSGEQSLSTKLENACEFPGEEHFIVEGSYGTKVKPAMFDFGSRIQGNHAQGQLDSSTYCASVTLCVLGNAKLCMVYQYMYF